MSVIFYEYIPEVIIRGSTKNVVIIFTVQLFSHSTAHTLFKTGPSYAKIQCVRVKLLGLALGQVLYLNLGTEKAIDAEIVGS